MIEIIFNGGLGNQISQFAMMQLLHHLYPNEKICYSLNTTDHNGFELFHIFPNLQQHCGQPVGAKLKLLRKAFGAIHRLNTIQQVYSSGYPEDPQLYALKKAHWHRIIGTWHSYNYQSIIQHLQDLLTWQNLSATTSSIALGMQQQGTVAIHIRRGDYASSGLDIVGKSFYNKALEIVSQRIGISKLYIFSDDTAYSKHLLADISKCYNVEFIQHNRGRDSWQDMYLMSLAQCIIATNSTFSYWAGELNLRPDRVLIRPEFQTPDRKTWNNPNWHTLTL